MPRPFSRICSRTGCPADGHRAGSSRVSTSTWQPSTAWSWRWTVSCAGRRQPARSGRRPRPKRCTNSDPLGRPGGRPPTVRQPQRRAVLQPAGTSTTRLRSSSRRPSPRHCVHGVGIVSPRPGSGRQAAAVTTWRAATGGCGGSRRSLGSRARDGRGAGPGTGPLAGLTTDRAGGPRAPCGHQGGLGEGEAQRDLGVGPGHRAPAPASPAATRHLTEEGLEDVAEATVEVER